ncbi:MAG: hypothetical protein WCW54_02885 [Candidatus Paceibacterota bacterium]
MKRVIFDILLFLFIFLLPWWATFIWVVIGLFVFMNFYEFLIASIIIYIISTIPPNTIWSKSLIVYSFIIIFYLLVQYLRRHIILYKNEIPHQS